jgi:hypothetical protein
MLPDCLRLLNKLIVTEKVVKELIEALRAETDADLIIPF